MTECSDLQTGGPLADALNGLYPSRLEATRSTKPRLAPHSEPKWKPLQADVDATTALDVADQLRAIIDALPPITPRDAHLAALLTEAAELAERRIEIT
jgi:hypothetical protein